MKNSLSLVLIIMLFVVMGCSMLGSKTGEDKVDTPNPNNTEATGKSSDSTTDSDVPKTSSGDTAELTADKFSQLKNGMSYEDVVKILGSEGTQTSSSKFGKTEVSSYKWEGDKYQRVYATFKDNKMTSKTQSGLTDKSSENAETADISMDKFNQIKIGMNYEDVVKIIGSEGEQTSSSKFGSNELKSYAWKGTKYSRINATFRNGELSRKSQSGLK